MTVSREEAARALAEMQAAERRSGELAGYAGGGPVLVVWGVEWLVCNLVTQFAPAWSGRAWMAGTVLAVIATVAVSRAARPLGGWRRLAAAAVAASWFACLFLIAGVHDIRASDALISLAAAAAYVLMGLWAGHRWLWLGLGLWALIFAAWFLAGPWFFLWMGLAGGGALILGGQWLRRA